MPTSPFNHCNLDISQSSCSSESLMCHTLMPPAPLHCHHHRPPAHPFHPSSPCIQSAFSNHNVDVYRGLKAPRNPPSPRLQPSLAPSTPWSVLWSHMPFSRSDTGKIRWCTDQLQAVPLQSTLTLGFTRHILRDVFPCPQFKS